MFRFLKKLFCRRASGTFRGRRRTQDDAITFRMKAGFPGEVNRTHPAGIEPCLASVNSAPTAYGQPVIVDAADTNRGVRPLAAGDSGLTAVYGFTVRPFPLQASSSAVGYGGTQAEGGAVTPNGTPPPGAIDVLRQGYMICQLNANQTAPVKGGQVYVRVAATSGDHIQNQLESTADAGNNIALSAAGSIATFQGPADANGLVEIAFNV